MKLLSDMTDKEIANLNEGEVASIVLLEMMNEGVKDVKEPAMEAVPAVPESEKVTVFNVNIRPKNGYPRTIASFLSWGDAEAFTKLSAVMSDIDYSSDAKFFVAGEFSIESEERLTEESFNDVKAAMTESKRVTERNNKRTDEYRKDRKDCDAVRSSVWDEIHRCNRVKAKAEEVAETFDSYLSHTGDDEKMAFTFLLKAYSEEEVDLATEWVGIPDRHRDTEANGN